MCLVNHPEQLGKGLDSAPLRERTLQDAERRRPVQRAKWTPSSSFMKEVETFENLSSNGGGTPKQD